MISWRRDNKNDYVSDLGHLLMHITGDLAKVAPKGVKYPKHYWMAIRRDGSPVIFTDLKENKEGVYPFKTSKQAMLFLEVHDL